MEKRWVERDHKYLLIALIGLFFAALILPNLVIEGRSPLMIGPDSLVILFAIMFITSFTAMMCYISITKTYLIVGKKYIRKPRKIKVRDRGYDWEEVKERL